MPKKAKTPDAPVLDQVLLVGLVFGALTIITRGSWIGTAFEAIALICGIIWSYRAITTHPSKVFRSAAALVFTLVGIWIWLALVATYRLV